MKTLHHKNYEYIKTLIKHGETVILEGEAGSGKTTLLMQIAKALKTTFYSITGTQQTSVANLLGFIAVNGTYISTQLRQAYEFGGLYLMDEYDAFNPNTILALNSIENGFLAFPDKVVYAHKDFILCATCNPSNQHAAFTGRSKQDAAALDRFLNVPLDRDPSLELGLTSKRATAYANKMRTLLKDTGVRTRVISMRDVMRFNRLDTLYSAGVISHNPVNTLIGGNVELTEDMTKFSEQLRISTLTIQDAANIDELYKIIKAKKDS